SLRAYVLADHLASRAFPVDITCDIAVDQWASWWQHTKVVHFPTLSRWLRRPPRQVQETRTVTGQKWVDVQSYAAFPDAAIYPPDLGPVHVLQRTEVVR
ncbi:MAG TPA: hypothetical protein VD926_04600, partial [Acidimicrobiales bacterium]|nr:hypothetical protein [Acidimicrobiales bacterium]